MKRYSLVAYGPGRTEVTALFTALHEQGCEIDSCLLTTFGPGFGAAMLVAARKQNILCVVKSLNKRLNIKAVPCGADGIGTPGNLQITLYGPNRPEAMRNVCELIASVKGEITEIESRSIGAASVFSIQAWCPGRLSSIRAKFHAMSKTLGLKHSIERIKLEDLI